MKDKKTKLIDDITVLMMCILTPPVFIYVATILVLALIPTLHLICAFVASICVMLGTLFDILMDMSPVLFIFAIPIGLIMMQEFGGNGKNRR